MTTDLDRERLQRTLRRVAGGDRAAMAELYRSTSAKLYGVCLQIVRDDAEAEEVLQEVYLTVWKRAASYDAVKASPITWLVVIARSRAIDRLRASGSRVVRQSGPLDGAIDVADPAPDAESQLGRSDESRRLRNCLEGLDPDHAGLIRRAFFGGLSYSDLAQAAGKPLGTVKTWIRKGLMNLKVCLES
ncbi:MAG: sigma-70 family RNA polymerase sigma factor [Caulobacteraceae bacterium]|nr:MAG: sigma-70 family RNA polymerase sigma factor [Caulobacteraceae bacterium]